MYLYVLFFFQQKLFIWWAAWLTLKKSPLPKAQSTKAWFKGIVIGIAWLSCGQVHTHAYLPVTSSSGSTLKRSVYFIIDTLYL